MSATTATRLDYVYSDLKPRRFRLLVLHPGTKDSEISITLQEHHLPFNKERCISYEAISYTWEHQLQSQEICCDDRRLCITPNLRDALQSFRPPNAARILWADAICIDQGDAAEKSEQIGCMRLIFGHASRVLCWLGMESPVDGHLFHAISLYLKERISRPARAPERLNRPELLTQDERNLESFSAWYFRNQPKGSLSHFFRKPRIGCTYNSLLRALMELCGKDYFRRAWIFQETAVSDQTFICRGQQTLLWLDLVRAMASVTMEDIQVNGYPLNYGQAMVGMHLLRSHWAKQDAENDFFSVILNCCSSQCSDPRDFVYALLGICSADHGLNFIVDYSRTIGEVYTQATCEALDNYQTGPYTCGGNANYLFLLCGLTELHSRENIASWVPDYSATGHLDTWKYAGLNIYDVSKGDRMTRVADTGDLKMEVKVEIIDSVIAKTTSTQHDFVRNLKERCSFLYQHGKEESVSKDCRWRTLCGDLFVKDGEFMRAPSDFGISYQILVKKLNRMVEDTDDTNDKSDLTWDDRSSGFVQSCERWCSRKGEVGMTRDGRGTNLPPGTEIGDSICLVPGSNVPLVIRSRDHGMYSLVGWCYLEGAMFGELCPLRGHFITLI